MSIPTAENSVKLTIPGTARGEQGHEDTEMARKAAAYAFDLADERLGAVLARPRGRGFSPLWC